MDELRLIRVAYRGNRYDSTVRYSLKTNRILIFYYSNKNRHLEGCYVDIDETMAIYDALCSKT